MQGRLRGRMLRHGYPPDPIPMTARQRARYLLVQWPGMAARMVAWDVVERLQHRLPGLMGRRPPPSKIVDPGQRYRVAGE
jgi:hypothetical protein